jgi:calcineurin-like phosphoesterase family protein
MNTFFTADTHFNHANIIKYCHRPFATAGEMNQVLIDKWNDTVGPDDTVYHLGDFAYGTPDQVFDLVKALNGQIYVIWGNHDQPLRRLTSQMRRHYGRHYDAIKDRLTILGHHAEIEIEGQEITLNHYAMRVWNKSHHGSWQLYGHSHGSLPDDPTLRSIDVGVDVHNYRPISFHEVSTYMAKKNWMAIDHHGDRQEGGGKGLSKDDYARLERKRQYEMLKKEFGYAR